MATLSLEVFVVVHHHQILSCVRYYNSACHEKTIESYVFFSWQNTFVRMEWGREWLQWPNKPSSVRNKLFNGATFNEVIELNTFIFPHLKRGKSSHSGRRNQKKLGTFLIDKSLRPIKICAFQFQFQVLWLNFKEHRWTFWLQVAPKNKNRFNGVSWHIIYYSCVQMRT